MMYELARDANFYLGGSIITLRGNPFLVEGVDDGFIMSGEDLSTGEYIRESVNRSDVDLTPISLGYLNLGGKAYYTSRKPKRSWRQGLSRNNVRSDLHWEVLASKRAVPMYKGEYPSFREALEGVLNGDIIASVAFHRHMGLARSGEAALLIYKRNLVGRIVDGELRLEDKYFYLKEAIQEATK